MSVEPGPEPMEVVEEGPRPTFSLSLLQLVKGEQAQNGVAHGDYNMYRKRCGGKVASLCKLLKFQHGRTRYQKRKIEAATVTDVRFLHIVVFYAERAWAYAMHLKKENEKELSLPRRRHLIRRLRKAQAWAQQLLELCRECCDARSQLEADAYAAWLGGSLLLEQEKDWETALAKFKRAKMLYEEISKVVPLAQQGLFLHVVEDIQTSIRFCSYQLERKGGKAPSDAQLLQASDPKGQAGLDEIKVQLQALAQEAQQHQPAATMSLTWQGRTYPVKSERVAACLHQAAEFAGQLASAASAASAAPAAASVEAGGEGEGVGSASEPLLALYTRMINAYNEAKGHVRNALKSSSAAESDSQYRELVSLEMAIQGTVLESAVERGRLLAHDAEERFEAGLERVALGKRAREKDKYAKAEDVVRLLDTLSRSLTEMGELGARLGGRQGEELHERCAASLLQVQARRSYYIAQALLASDKALEAYVMFGRAAERVQEAQRRLQELGQQPAVKRELQELQHTADIAAAYRAVAHAEQAASSLKSQEAVQQGVGGLSLADAKDSADAQRHTYLAEQLEVWESFAGQPGAKAPRIYRVPFAMQSIPMRPIMLDTASNAIDYPSLEHRFKKKEQKTVFSSFFGWGSKK